MLAPHIPYGAAYRRGDIWSDWVAALTVSAILVPQSIAYALLAGMPPIHGLYAALLGGVAASLWGHTRYLSTGPIAIMSLLTFSAVSPLAAPGSASYIALVAALALFVGLFQIGLGLMHGGFFVRLVPLSVLVGFSSAAALIILLTQIPHLFGFSAPQEAFFPARIVHMFADVFALDWTTVAVAVTAALALFSIRKLHRALPATLIVLSGGIALSYFFDLPALGVSVAGDIPTRLPVSDVPEISLPLIISLGGHACVLALVGFMSSYAVVKDVSHKKNEQLDVNQELIGQGFANLFSGMFRGHPVGGSLSRTAVNVDAGARTAWAGVYASLTIVFVILFFSSALAYLPNAVLAVILVATVLPLIDIRGLRRMYDIAHTDGVIGVVTFVAVFILRLDQAILLGIVLALVLYMRKVMWVHVSEVGFHPEWRSLVSLASHPHAEVFPRMLMLRIDAPIFYANVERLSIEIEARIRDTEQAVGAAPSVVALDFSGVNLMDVTGVEGFSELIDELRKKGIKVLISTPRKEVREVLERGNIAHTVKFVHGTRELRLIGEAMSQGIRTLIA